MCDEHKYAYWKKQPSIEIVSVDSAVLEHDTSRSSKEKFQEGMPVKLNGW